MLLLDKQNSAVWQLRIIMIMIMIIIISVASATADVATTTTTTTTPYFSLNDVLKLASV